ncbi:MAG TPA: ester cyclase, partial [Ktedonobacterales bacterium]|nr:ester cyclase [Ktedonobacterales bacterium]
MSSEQTSGAEANKRIVRRYYDEVLGQRNFAALDELFAPDFVGHSASYGDFTLADMRAGIAREHQDMPSDETIIEDQVAEGDRVVTRWRYRWRHDTPLFGERPTGERLEMHGAQIDRLANGRIAERW